MQSGIALAIVLLANAAMTVLARSSLPRRELASIPASRGVTDLFLGHSLIEAALDSTAFMRSLPGSRVLNLALQGTSPVEHYLMYLAAGGVNAPRVHYGFFDLQLTELPRADVGGINGNRAVVYFLFPDTARRYLAENDGWARLKLMVAAQIPMVAYRGSIWGRVNQFRHRLSSVGVPPARANRFGNGVDFDEWELFIQTTFGDRLTKAVRGKRPLSPAVLATLRLAKRRREVIYFIIMPMPSRHRERFYATAEWKTYAGYVEALIVQEGGRFLDASTWMDDSLFGDAMHLNPSGAAEFSSRFAKYLSVDAARSGELLPRGSGAGH